MNTPIWRTQVECGGKKKAKPKSHHHLKPLVYISLWKPKTSSNIYSLLPIVHFVSLLTGLKKVGGNEMGFFQFMEYFSPDTLTPSSLYLPYLGVLISFLGKRTRNSQVPAAVITDCRTTRLYYQPELECYTKLEEFMRLQESLKA